MLTLQQLAHFDRCIFPESFANDLVENGLDEMNAFSIEMFIVRQRKNGNMVGVIQIYQEFITDDNVTNAIEKVVKAFIEKYP